MKFIWRENNNGLYYIVYANRKKEVNMNLIPFVSYLFKINKQTIERFIKENGGKKQLDNNYYFKNKNDVINVINQLNTMKNKQ